MAGKPPKRAGDQVEERVAQYVSSRLKAECQERGDAARIAAKIKFTDAALANAKNHATMGGKLVRALAKYWGMTIDQLEAVATGGAPPPEPPADSPPPPPVSQVRETEVSNDVIDELLAQAWDPKTHGPADARVVGEALRSQAALLKDHVDPVDVVRAMLDTAADVRSKGKTIAAEDLPIAALGTTKRKLSAAEAKIAYWMNQATLDAESMGLPIPDGPHPMLLAAQKAAFGDDFVEEPEEDDAPPPKKKGGKGGR